MMVGIFGAGMSTIRLGNGEHHFINNYSVAPAAAEADLYECLSDTWPDYQQVAAKQKTERLEDKITKLKQETTMLKIYVYGYLNPGMAERSPVTAEQCAQYYG